MKRLGNPEEADPGFNRLRQLNIFNFHPQWCDWRSIKLRCLDIEDNNFATKNDELMRCVCDFHRARGQGIRSFEALWGARLGRST